MLRVRTQPAVSFFCLETIFPLAAQETYPWYRWHFFLFPCAEGREHDSQRFPAQLCSKQRLLPGSFTFHNIPGICTRHMRQYLLSFIAGRILHRLHLLFNAMRRTEHSKPTPLREPLVFETSPARLSGSFPRVQLCGNHLEQS